MKRLFALFLSPLLVASALASTQIRDVQTELKNQGFYYGDITGNESSELTAAIRRYQIRNGLEVTGQLSSETLKALGMGGSAAPSKSTAKKAPATPSPSAPAPEPPRQATVTPTPGKPPVNLRKDEVVQDESLPPRRPYGSNRPMVRPPAPLDDEPVEEAPGSYRALFAGTPYATAPRELQQQTVRRAQALLRERGLYRDALDGDAGPATEEAILAFQRSARLPLTGRLDLQTLAQLRMLPGRGPGNPSLRPFNAAPDRPPQRVYRGVWVE